MLVLESDFEKLEHNFLKSYHTYSVMLVLSVKAYCDIGLTSEGGWLQQRCAESPLVKKPHKPYIRLLVTKRD